ncbi:hypothetical protein GUJ93_ZPchr0011g27727 [Zizania palustris]|uniref:Uncharacterized protein n=1 Tax=Zizania palustris TaxID=103762 RepID=A0A8J6BNT0_ZIZPA|nr:hypothetical protein GUJ93_ZPchr0011g27727 [Zizania palustris]
MDGVAEVGARPTAVWGSDLGGARLDLGGVVLGTRRTTFLGDSVRRMVARGSGDGSMRLGGRWRWLGPRLCGV